MALVDDFVNGITGCMNPAAPNLPQLGLILGPFGLKNELAGLLFTMLAGVDFVLDFIPPSPTNIPTLPGLQIFTDAMLGSLNFPANHPEFEFIPGIIIPEVTDGVDLGDLNIESAFKLVTGFISLPFEIILAIIDELLSLNLAIPSIALITQIMTTIFIGLGLIPIPPALPSLGMLNLLTCVPVALFDLLTDLVLP